MPGPLGRRTLAEFIGAAFLVMAVVGSGIAAARLSPGDIGLDLLENAAVTGAALAAIIWRSVPSPVLTSTRSSLWSSGASDG